jgi:hypothetical protein
MKSIWRSFGLASLLIANIALAKPTHVQNNYACPQAPTATLPVTYNAVQTAGNLNVVVVGWNDSSATVLSVTDSKGNAYLGAVGPTIVNGALSQSIYYAKNIVGATPNSNVVTVAFDRVPAYPDVRIAEYSGVDAVSPLDVSTAATGTVLANNSGSVTTKNANDLLVGASMVLTTTKSAGPNYTKRIITSPDSDLLEDRVVTSIDSYNATATLNSSGNWIMQMVAFKATGSPTPPPAAGPTATPTPSPTATPTPTPRPRSTPPPTPSPTPTPTPAPSPTPTPSSAPTPTPPPSPTPSPTPTPGTPTLIQHVSTFINSHAGPTGANAEAGNQFYINLPNMTGAGNCLRRWTLRVLWELILSVTCPYASNRQVTITDDQGDLWALGASVNNGKALSSVYYALNVAAGVQKVTVTFDDYLFNCQFELTEFYNVAGVSALEATSGSTSSLSTVSAGGLITASAGDLIYLYGFDTDAYGTTTPPSLTSISAGPGFYLLSADVMLGTVAEYAVQTTAGAINPSANIVSSIDSFNAIAIALRSAHQGTAPPPGIRIVHVYHVLYSNRNVPLIFPSVGNLLIVTTAFNRNNQLVSAISSNLGNVWTMNSQNLIGGNFFPSQFFWAANANTAQNLTITPIGPGTGDDAVTFVLYDVVNAASAPYDTAAGQPTFNINNTGRTIYNAPVINPSTPNGLVFAVMNNASGPTTGLTVAGEVLDTVTYGGEIDADAIDNADGYAHFNNPTASPVPFNWSMNCSSLPEESLAIAIAFKGVAQ